MLKTLAPMRRPDVWGSGEFGASRGSRKHRGVDYQAIPGAVVLSNVAGRVTKIGHPYSDDLSYRYVEVTDTEGNRVRYFYVDPDPSLNVGRKVYINTALGTVQGLDRRYAGITEHVHIEVINPAGEHVDPGTVLHDGVHWPEAPQEGDAA